MNLLRTFDHCPQCGNSICRMNVAHRFLCFSCRKCWHIEDVIAEAGRSHHLDELPSNNLFDAIVRGELEARQVVNGEGGAA